MSYPGVGISSNDSSWGDALAAVAASDATILALGTDQTIGHEAMDVADIGLPAAQQAFAAAVFSAAGNKPVIVLLVSAFPTSFDTVAEPADAIVIAYTPSFGAREVAAALFGVNRWGRAVLTVYPHAYQSAVAMDDYRMPPGPNTPGRCAAHAPHACDRVVFVC